MMPSMFMTALKILDYFEMSRLPIRGISGEALYGIPLWEIVRFKQAMIDIDPQLWRDWFLPVGHAGVIQRINNDHYQWLKVIDRGEKDVVYYPCPERLLVLPIDKKEIEVYKVHLSTFLYHLSEYFHLEEFNLYAKRTELVDILWQLGTLTLSDGSYAVVYVVRGLIRYRKEVASLLKKEHRPVFLLSTGKRLPLDVEWSDNVTVRCLCDSIVTLSQTSIELDLNYLFNLRSDRLNYQATLAAPTAPHPDIPVRYDPETHILSIEGKPDWYVKGERRSLAINYMYKQAQHGRWELPAKEILEATKVPGQKGGAIRMQSLFSNSLDWELYISSPKRGYYKFNV